MTTTAKLTLEQFLAMPETEPASEYACGEVVQKPMLTRKHSFVQTYLVRLLDEFLEGTGLRRVGTEWRCIFGPPGEERALVPDLIYVSREHLTDEDYHHGAPDLAIEVLSPGQSAGDFAERVQFYLLNGTRMLWVFDPAQQVVTVYAPDRNPRRLNAGDVLDGGDLLPGFSVPVGAIFARMRV